MKKSIALFSLIGSIGFAHNSFAQTACQTSNGAVTDTNQNCWAQPQSLKTTIFKIGLCTAQPTAPTSSTPIDLSSCQTVFLNSSGSEISIVKGVATTLSGTITKPAVGSYTYAYAIVSPVFKQSTLLTFTPARTNLPSSGAPSSGTVCWSKQGDFYSYRSTRATDLVECGSVAPSSIGETSSKSNVVGVDSQNNPLMSKDLGSITAHLVDSTYKTAVSSAGSMGNISYVVGVMPASSPWVVSASTKNLDISFNVTSGTTVEINDIGTQIEAFGSGPFSPVITLN
jgi:hypothetical protein